MKKILIIIPAFNEENRIVTLLPKVIDFGYDIIVVNDGSTDNTADVVKKMGVNVINIPINLGAGASLQAGYKYAIENGYDYILNLDGDGQHDPAYISDMLKPILEGQEDIVIGSRFLCKESYTPPFARRVGMKLFVNIAKIITKKKFTDTTSGYKAMTSEVAKLFASPSFPSDYPDVDTLILLHLRGFRICEIPVRMFANNEQSIHKGIIRPVYYVFKMMFSIVLTLLREWPSYRKLTKNQSRRIQEV